MGDLRPVGDWCPRGGVMQGVLGGCVMQGVLEGCVSDVC